MLINRRDFPGSDPYTERELATLASLQSAPNALDLIQQFMTDRARELYDFLVKFIAQEDIPLSYGSAGGLILAGWSFGNTWITSFLQQLAHFPVTDIDLRGYLRRIVLYDPPCHSVGVASPETKYDPFEDETIPLLERPEAFNKWVTGYFTHGESAETLELRTPAAEPRPSILSITQEELVRAFHPGPAGPEGSDRLLVLAGIASGLNRIMKEEGFYPEGEDPWKHVEVRYLWCSQSVYEGPWGAWALRKELEEANKAGRRTRNINVVCLRGANHFVSPLCGLSLCLDLTYLLQAHWDIPDRLLRAFLINEETAKL